MDLFNKEKNTGLRLTITNIVLLLVVTIVLLQLLGLLLGDLLSIKLGPIIIVIAILLTSAMGFAILKKLLTNMPVTKQDVFGIIIIALITLAVMFFLRDMVPEIFKQSLYSLQAMIT